MAKLNSKNIKSPKQKDLKRFAYGEAIILGFTGSLGSGCTYISEGIKNTIGSDAFRYVLSDIIETSLKKKGIKAPSIQQKQDEGDLLRKENGLSVLAEMCLDAIKKDENKLNENSVILIDGIRNTGEVRCLRAFPNFYLISVHAPEKERETRLVGGTAKRRLFATSQNFKEADARDREEEIANGQQVERCNDLADIIINNEEELQDNTARKNKFFSELVQKYILVMQGIRGDVPLIDRSPSINEALMTMAYCISKKSSCEKRKVGAIIAYIKEFDHLKEKVKRPEDNNKFQVISTGYNEVPLGTDPCKLGKYKKCYRDHLKEQLSTEYKNCPNCGRQIPQKIKCPKCSRSMKRGLLYCSNSECKADLLTNYSCRRCKQKIFKSYLPGSAQGAGKLLDMCRALHGEETAIIGLAGMSKPNNGKIVLYTTTFPCNLCANKIVAAGINLVIFAEPYTMEEAEKILEDGRVKTVKFEGVKSTAYFRLYS
ncbi:hypothetical protein ACFL3Q_09330 [Planctomycetota bacterium]